MRSLPNAFAVVGFKNSGKTTLAAELVQELAGRGRKVGAVKFSHHNLDKESRDTERLFRHAHSVAGFGPDETALFLKGQRALMDMVPLLEADVLVVEGGKHLENLPRVLVGDPDEDAAALNSGLALAAWRADFEGLRRIDDITELADLVEQRGFFLPSINCEACGRASCADLARDIVQGKVGREACLSLDGGVRIEVNGQPLALGPFVEKLVASALDGLFKELKGYAPGTVTITMER